MTEEINNRQVRSSVRNGGLGLILVLLLVAFLIFSFWYPRDDGRTYGDVALLEAQNFKSKVMRDIHVAYECTTKESKSKGIDLAVNSAALDGAKASGGALTFPATQEAAVAVGVSDTLSSSLSTAAEIANLPIFHTNPILPPGVINSNAAVPLTYSSASSATPQGAPLSVPAPNRQALAGIAPIPDSPQTGQSFQPYPIFSGGQEAFAGSYRPQSGQFSAPPEGSEGASIQPDNFLLAARESIAGHRYQEGVLLYRKQLSDNPSDIDAYGELGNVLMFAQNYPYAAKNYYEAATRLLDAGLPEVAKPLLPVIERYEPLLANLLKQKAAQLDR
jgi:hypothetical protein